VGPSAQNFLPFAFCLPLAGRAPAIRADKIFEVTVSGAVGKVSSECAVANSSLRAGNTLNEKTRRTFQGPP
jgi:hypothetical protein